MRTINIHEAKTHLSKLIELAAEGESFIIAKAGRPLVKVVPLNQSERTKAKRLGFMQGEFQVPDDFDQMASNEIDQLFNGSEN
ncbi:MAG: type II toxin-antitoxin system Phd/YefM family antitoxin [Methylococcaceae bacterium]